LFVIESIKIVQSPVHPEFNCFDTIFKAKFTGVLRVFEITNEYLFHEVDDIVNNPNIVLP
jgi:hypothetical protein